ncbi:D-glycero-beta-D-manno-heptose 1-phosphate adenylyltransferase [Azotosporobacter soli]|uniref:D-glycero-beta-D-manno-heptose 1-phosphate adenylyltransferase n=1 Tax=Azotosporobacter soli TaxID=3055040 RepID=UPI0031FE8E4E
MKLIERQDIPKLREKWQAEGARVVFTNGCFDILHAGHVRYLQAARELGDCLVLGLNSDASVQRLKGPSRPINSEEDRAEVLAALSAIDYVVIFSEQTAEELVREVRPNVYVKGGDYNVKSLPEADIVAAYGGETVLIPEVPGRSSSKVIAKIKENQV